MPARRNHPTWRYLACAALAAFGAAHCAMSEDLRADKAAPSLEAATASALATIDTPTLKAHVAALAAPALKGRLTGSPEDASARAYIEGALKACGIQDVRSQTFTDPFGRPSANVIAQIPGHDLAGEVVVVGAHHDHLGDGHLGANDNASGVAALIEAACAAQQVKDSLRRTTTFIAFGAEEPSACEQTECTDDEVVLFHGSQHFVSSGLFSPKTVYMINLDMIGTYAQDGLVFGLGAPSSPRAQALLQGILRRYPLNADLSTPPTSDDDDNSDYAPFKRRGVPYVFFWTEDEDCYHERCDTADRVDYAGLTQITQVVTELLLQVANADTKP